MRESVPPSRIQCARLDPSDRRGREAGELREFLTGDAAERAHALHDRRRVDNPTSFVWVYAIKAEDA